MNTHRRVQPEHGGDQLPGERQDPNPDTGNSDTLHKLVKLVVGEFWTGHKRQTGIIGGGAVFSHITDGRQLI